MNLTPNIPHDWQTIIVEGLFIFHPKSRRSWTVPWSLVSLIFATAWITALGLTFSPFFRRNSTRSRWSLSHAHCTASVSSNQASAFGCSGEYSLSVSEVGDSGAFSHFAREVLISANGAFDAHRVLSSIAAVSNILTRSVRGGGSEEAPPSLVASPSAAVWANVIW